MGGQACVLYGAAEFSRDTDFALLSSEENLALLRVALRELRAKRIALPPFEPMYLGRGHAIHFRSYHPDAMNMRIDVMSVMRGVDPFDQLWNRRARLAGSGSEAFDVLSLSDLVRAKKTQRDKDWPMIRRLVEADYVREENPSADQVKFWLLESRTPGMLVELAQTYRAETEAIKDMRKALREALDANEGAIEEELDLEVKRERDADRRYWEPLRKELEDLRRMDIVSEEEV